MTNVTQNWDFSAWDVRSKTREIVTAASRMQKYQIIFSGRKIVHFFIVTGNSLVFKRKKINQFD